MPSPHGTLADLNIIQKQIGVLKMFLGRNAVSAYKTLSALIKSEYTTIDTLIQGSSSNTGLSADATLSLRFEYSPDPKIANDNGTADAGSTTVTGKY